MKFITIMGSPRKSGTTARVLDTLEARLSQQSHEISRVSIAEMDISGCEGCGECQKNPGSWTCRQKDDCRAVFDAMRSADGVVYATPLYGWDYAGQMKLFLDRHFCLVNGYGSASHCSALAGLRSLLLVTCAGPEKGNADLIQQAFDRFCGYTAMENRGKLVLSAKTGITDEAVLAAAETMADSLLR
jgi:NAD(P)H-dependent FMN reductase